MMPAVPYLRNSLPWEGLTTYAVVVVIVGLYFTLTTIYRLFFHPLAKFPGPKLAAATKWYEFYFDLLKSPGGQFSKEVDRMHDVYGPIVRINPDELHVRDPDWYDVLYAPNPTYRDKYPPAAKMAGTNLGSFGTVLHDVHRKRRAANAPLFSKRAIRDAQGLIRKQLGRLTETLSQAMIKNEPIELHTLFIAFTTDTLCFYAFDMNFGLMDDPTAARNWKTTMKSVAAVTPLVKQFPWIITAAKSAPRPLLRMILPDLSRLLDVHVRMYHRVSEYMASKTKTETEELKENGGPRINLEKPPTLFHALDRSSLPPHEKNRRRLQQEGATILLAGGETTARALAHTMFHLIANPHVLENVKREVKEATTDEDETCPGLKTLESLPWLVASVREALRLAALVSSRFPLMANTELVYDKWLIPSQTPVSMTPASVLHDPGVYSEPMAFRPERWFHATERENRCYVPFGRGTRMCQGMDFAYAEMYLTIATLVQRFDFALFDTIRERDVDPMRDCFLGEPDPRSVGIRVKVLRDRQSAGFPRQALPT